MDTERFNLDLDTASVEAMARIRACMGATSDSEVVRRVLQDWDPDEGGSSTQKAGPRQRLHLRLPERVSALLREHAERTGLTYPGVVANALAAFLPKVDAYEIRAAAGVRTKEPPPFL